MSMKDLVVHVDGSERASERVDLAITLSRRLGARLTALFAESASLGSSLVGRRSREHVLEAMQTARAAFQAKTSAAGVDAKWWELEPEDDPGRVIGSVAICCRYADLVVFGQHDPDGARVPDTLVESVVLESGRPVLVVPSIGHYEDVGKRVIIAWTGSRDSARAVNDAVPLLRGAQLVTVLAFQQPSDGLAPSPFPKLDIVAHLGAHGIAARYERFIVHDDDDVGMVDSVLNRAADVTADLVVMGARAGRGFPLERMSSNPRAMLRTMTAPVLLST